MIGTRSDAVPASVDIGCKNGEHGCWTEKQQLRSRRTVEAQASDSKFLTCTGPNGSEIIEITQGLYSSPTDIPTIF